MVLTETSLMPRTSMAVWASRSLATSAKLVLVLSCSCMRATFCVPRPAPAGAMVRP